MDPDPLRVSCSSSPAVSGLRTGRLRRSQDRNGESPPGDRKEPAGKSLPE